MLQWIRELFLPPPVCPVNEDDRAWVDYRFAWLVDEFGIDSLRRSTTILPTAQFFPERYHATEKEVHNLLITVAQQMEVDPDCLWLSFFEDRPGSICNEQWRSPSSLCHEIEEGGYYRIELNISGLNDPLWVVSTLAHEISFVRLIGQERTSPYEADLDSLKELLTIFQGLGTCTSSSVLPQARWVNGGWSMPRIAHLSMDMYGYALGLYALARGEKRPSWLKYLRPDVRFACTNTIRLKLQEQQIA